jgi:hypothetical protein
MKNEIILYSQNDHAEHIEVRLRDDTVWLNRNQLVLLFGRDVKTIGKHINNVFLEGELNEKATVAKFATVQLEGNRKIEREISNACLVRRWPSDSASAKADRYNRQRRPLDWRNSIERSEIFTGKVSLSSYSKNLYIT